VRVHRIATAAAVVIGLALPSAAQATAIHVTTNADSGGQCTLRNAINAANNNLATGACDAGQPAPTVDTIDFTGLGGQPITLGSTLPPLFGLLSIAGPGASQLTIDGNDLVQPLQVNGGTITISGLTIANGRCGAGCGSEGGAILEAGGDLTLDSVAVSGNTAVHAVAQADDTAEGGAIEVSGATLHVVNSTISGNTVTADSGTAQNGASGGAIGNRGTVTIDRSTLSGNQATAAAAGGATSTVSGGAILNGGHLTITRSTLSGNSLATSGAGSPSANGGAINEISTPAIMLQIDRSTVVGNTITSTGGGSGGGIFSIGAPGTITSSTISSNSASTGANLALSEPVTLSNSIVTNPLVGPNCTLSVISAGYNIESTDTCGIHQSSDHPNTAPMLMGLADNGGPTQTRAPQADSPAIDQGHAAVGETTDQRGLIRPSDIFATADAPGGDGSDVGAVEVQDTVAPDTTIDSGPEDGSTIPDAAPAFAFSSTETGSQFECSVDGAGFAGCSSPDTLSALGDGPHSFAVRAVDGTGNADASPASRSFTVQVPDKTPPQTTITKAPKSKSSKSKAKYKFKSSEPNSTFECAFDSKKFKPCDSGKAKYKHLDFGRHKFLVRATDAAGNADQSPARDKFKRKH
jgi:hypothetical protein